MSSLKEQTLLFFLAAIFVCLITACSGQSTDQMQRMDLSPDQAERVAHILQAPVQFDTAEAFEINSGGAGSGPGQANAEAYSHPNPLLSDEQELSFRVGNGLFRKVWVSAPASTAASDGLGPLFNARACQACHIKDGRGLPRDETGHHASLTFLLSAAKDKAALGVQIQDQAIAGQSPEALIEIRDTSWSVRLKGGEQVVLKTPAYHFTDPGTGAERPLTPSPRLAGPVFGMGLLDAIHPADLFALADPEDKDQDGISGRLNWVEGQQGEKAIGRFGWRAETATLEQQITKALANDMGLSSSHHPAPWGDCTAIQTACRTAPHGDADSFDTHEASDQMITLMAAYLRGLAVPKRRQAEAPDVLHGKKLFHQTGCASCHQPKFVTRNDPALGVHAYQLIWPYTDLLLHDMGPALADQPETPTADNREWRTPPLWGLGLTHTVNPAAGFLHDGRARTIQEAILWHGGEAQRARDIYTSLEPEERAALLKFLNSL